MADVFISHIEEDAEVAETIAHSLEGAGYTTWYYERDTSSARADFAEVRGDRRWVTHAAAREAVLDELTRKRHNSA